MKKSELTSVIVGGGILVETTFHKGKVYELIAVTKFEEDARTRVKTLQESGKWAFFSTEGRIRKVWCA